MPNYAYRLARIEQAMTPSIAPRLDVGYIDYNDRGLPATLELCGRSFSPLPGETEDTFVERANRECGGENLILVRYVKAVNGRPAPGFERF